MLRFLAMFILAKFVLVLISLVLLELILQNLAHFRNDKWLRCLLRFVGLKGTI